MKNEETKGENEWFVHFINEATEEQIMHLFQTGIDESVQKDIRQLLLKHRNEQSN